LRVLGPSTLVEEAIATWKGETFRDRIALISGAGSGIGRATAQMMGAEGCIANVRQIRIGSKHGMISPSTT
jgi:hypothetical protein